MKSRVYPVIAVMIVGVLITMTWWNTTQRSSVKTGAIVAHDVAQLVSIFERIDRECDIISFDYQKNPINFLNVKKFTGSEVGPMNLGHPDKWQGPYLEDNPTIQGKEYQIVRTNAGHFITPGHGVRLPNGKVIGGDIVLDEAADINSMMTDDQQLQWDGKSLAAPLSISHNVLGDLPLERMVSLPANMPAESSVRLAKR